MLMYKIHVLQFIKFHGGNYILCLYRLQLDATTLATQVTHEECPASGFFRTSYSALLDSAEKH